MSNNTIDSDTVVLWHEKLDTLTYSCRATAGDIIRYQLQRNPHFSSYNEALADFMSTHNAAIEPPHPPKDVAEVIDAALDLYIRILLGQFEEIHRLALFGFVPLHSSDPDAPRRVASAENLRALRSALDAAKEALHFPVSASYGVYHPHVHPHARIALEYLHRKEKP